MSGTLCIFHVLGTSKIILNVVSSDKGFFVNGDAQVGGNHLVASIDSSAYIKGVNAQTNKYNLCPEYKWYTLCNHVSYAQFDYSDNCCKSIRHVDAGNRTRTGNIWKVDLNALQPDK